MQEIDIAKDDDGQMTITTERRLLDVIASDDIYYGLELKYYDQKRYAHQPSVLGLSLHEG